MGFESPLTPPPSVETQPKPLVSPESVAAETQSLATELPSSTSLTEQLAQQAAEQQREARIAQLKAEIMGEPTPVEKGEDPKKKSFDEKKARFEEELQKRAADPENPVNKISMMLAQDKSIGATLKNGWDSRTGIAQRIGVEQGALDEALPDLLTKGVITEDQFAGYVYNTISEGNRYNLARFDKLIESIPAQTLNKIADTSSSFNAVLDEWYVATRAQVDKELALKRPTSSGEMLHDNPDKLLKVISDIGRFSPKGELNTALQDAMESFRKTPQFQQLRRVKNNQYEYPGIGNLFEAGYSEQAEEILEKGLERRQILFPTVLEYLQKGFISEEKAMAMLEKSGALN